MALSRELKRAQAKYNIGIEAIHLSGQLICTHGTDGASRAMPFLGMYSGMEGTHDLFDPVEWPRFALQGELARISATARRNSTQDASDPHDWIRQEFSGEDTYLHLRPAHVASALERLMEAQLRDGANTAFTVITPAVGLRAWKKYMKHFRKKTLVPLEVVGLGDVKHWVLRYERGDGLLPRAYSACEPQAENGDGEEEDAGGWQQWWK